MTVRTGQICQLWIWNMILGVKNCWTEFKNLGRFDIKITKCPMLTKFGSEKNSNILNWWRGPRNTILGQFVSKSYICSNFYEIQHLEGVYTWNFILGWNHPRLLWNVSYIYVLAQMEFHPSMKSTLSKMQGFFFFLLFK